MAFILGFTPGRHIGIHVYATGCKATGMHLWEQLHGWPVFVCWPRGPPGLLALAGPPRGTGTRLLATLSPPTCQ